MKVLVGLLVVIGGVSCSQVDHIEIAPPQAILNTRGAELQVKGTAVSRNGAALPKSKIVWEVADTSIATIDSQGLLRPLRSGQTELLAHADNATASIMVEVLFAEKIVVEPNPVLLVEGEPSKDLKVQVFDYKGRVLLGRQVLFRSQDESVVHMGQNVAMPGFPGKATVRVDCDGVIQEVPALVEATKKRLK